MSELRRYVIGLDLETRVRIQEMAKDLNVSESRLVRIAVDFYELCLNKVADVIVEGSAGECRDDIEEVGVSES